MTAVNIDLGHDGLIVRAPLDARNAMSSTRAKFVLAPLGLVATGEDSYLIRCESSQVIEQLAFAERVFGKLGIGVETGSAANEQLSGYLEERNRFMAFARRAAEIWAGNVDAEELRLFSEYLNEAWPRRRLYTLQLLAAYHLTFSRNACNFSVPGSGKTACVYAAYGFMRDQSESPVNKLVVVGPISSFVAWEDEFRECFGKPVNSVRLSGSMSSQDRKQILVSAQDADDGPEVLLTSYQTFSNSIEDFVSFMNRPDISAMLVLDEAHRAKNTDGGVWAEAVLRAAPFATSRVVLTGTPAPNGYDDLYNLFRIIWPSQEIIPFKVGQLRDMSDRPGDRRVDSLNDAIKPFYVRIRKSDLGLIPPVNHEPELLEMGPIQRRIYQYLEDKTLRYIARAGYRNTVHSYLSRASAIRLMQAASYPGLLKVPLDTAILKDDAEIEIDDPWIVTAIREYDETEVPIKFQRAVEITRTLVERHNERVVIWCNYIESMRRLHHMFAAHGLQSRLLYSGSTNEFEEDEEGQQSRDEVIRAFHRDDTPFRILIANPMAVGESISLHKVCSHAIYVERNFNAGLYLQSKDRIHRVGMPEGRTANYHVLLSSGSVDTVVQTRLRAKIERMLAIIESDEIPLLNMGSLDDDVGNSDLIAIIREYESRPRAP